MHFNIFELSNLSTKHIKSNLQHRKFENKHKRRLVSKLDNNILR